MTILDLAKRLLAYADIRFTGADDMPDDAQQDDVADKINGGLQELFTLLPAALARQPHEDTFHAPLTVTGTVVNGSRDLVLPQFEEWMIRASVRIAGDNRLHEIARVTGYSNTPPNPATVVLRAPVSAPSGSVSVTIYGDCITPPDNVAKILPGVLIDEDTPLTRVGSPEALRRSDRDGVFVRDYGRMVRVSGGNPGVPSHYLLAAVHPATVATDFVIGTLNRTPSRYLRCWPLPAEAHPVRFEVEVRPPRYAIEDFAFDEEEPDEVPEPPIDQSWHELYLLPIALQRYTASPFFKNNEVKDEIGRQYRTAIEALAKMEPAGATRVRLSLRH